MVDRGGAVGLRAAEGAHRSGGAMAAVAKLAVAARQGTGKHDEGTGVMRTLRQA